MKDGAKLWRFLQLDQVQWTPNSSHLTCQHYITTISLLRLAKYCHLKYLFMKGWRKS